MKLDQFKYLYFLTMSVLAIKTFLLQNIRTGKYWENLQSNASLMRGMCLFFQFLKNIFFSSQVKMLDIWGLNGLSKQISVWFQASKEQKLPGCLVLRHQEKSVLLILLAHLVVFDTINQGFLLSCLTLQWLYSGLVIWFQKVTLRIYAVGFHRDQSYSSFC